MSEKGISFAVVTLFPEMFGAYDVVVSSKLLSKFTNSKYNLTYFIALEPDSTFG